jgi:hypothetical protein
MNASFADDPANGCIIGPVEPEDQLVQAAGQIDRRVERHVAI